MDPIPITFDVSMMRQFAETIIRSLVRAIEWWQSMVWLASTLLTVAIVIMLLIIQSAAVVHELICIAVVMLLVSFRLLSVCLEFDFDRKGL